MGNLYTPASAISFVPAAHVTFTQAAGAPGWIADVDISASLPAAAAGKLCLFYYSSNAGAGAIQDAGVRDVDSSVDCHISMGTFGGGGQSGHIIAKVSSTRTVDFYRAAADNYYTYQGYFN